MKKIWAIGVLVLLLAGCDKPKIDATSDESMKQSIEKVRESLPENKRAEFDNAIKVAIFSNVNFADILNSGASVDKEELDRKFRETLSGKTGDEVISYAQKINAERELKQKQQAIAEINELEKKKASAEKSKEDLKKFEVLSSRFSLEKGSLGVPQPKIKLQVKNNTGKTISRAFFYGVITSPNRSVPWFEEDFNLEIPGGIEAGEEATWNLEPNMFSDWAKVNAPSDAVFTVTVMRLDGNDKKTLFDASGFTQQDQERLDSLKEKVK